MKKLITAITAFLRRAMYFFDYVLWIPLWVRFITSSKIGYFKAFTHLTKKERLLLYKLALSTKQYATVVEIGSYLGASSLFLASAMKVRSGKVYCVDTWANNGMSEGARDTYDDFCRNTRFLEKHIVPLRGYSTAVAATFSNQIDMIFFDGGHSYEMVKADVEAWLPKLANHGLAVFHDVRWSPGVHRVVNECIKFRRVEDGLLDNTYWARVCR